MTVFIEDTLLENFLITYLIINIIYNFIKEKKNIVRQIIASIFGAMISLVYPLVNLNKIFMFLLKMFIGFIISCIGYKTKKLKNLVFFYIMFVLITSVYGGINLMLYFIIYGNFESNQKLPSLLIIFLMLIITYFLNQCSLRIYQKKQVNNFLFEVIIKNNDKTIVTNAYLDSGNILYDPIQNKPVVLINYKLFQQLYNEFPIQNLLTQKVDGLKNGHYINIKTATGKDKILAFNIDLIEIKINNDNHIINNPVLALSKVNISGLECDVLLNAQLLKGV